MIFRLNANARRAKRLGVEKKSIRESLGSFVVVSFGFCLDVSMLSFSGCYLDCEFVVGPRTRRCVFFVC